MERPLYRSLLYPLACRISQADFFSSHKGPRTTGDLGRDRVPRFIGPARRLYAIRGSWFDEWSPWAAKTERSRVAPPALDPRPPSHLFLFCLKRGESCIEIFFPRRPVGKDRKYLFSTCFGSRGPREPDRLAHPTVVQGSAFGTTSEATGLKGSCMEIKHRSRRDSIAIPGFKKRLS